MGDLSLGNLVTSLVIFSILGRFSGDYQSPAAPVSQNQCPVSPNHNKPQSKNRYMFVKIVIHYFLVPSSSKVLDICV